MTHPTRRKYESPRQLARQARILATAREMVTQQGYEGLTMRGLADRAGVAPATLYNLYRSKDGLFLAAVADLLDQLDQNVSDTEPARGLPTLFERTATVCRQVRETPDYAEAMTRMLSRLRPEDALVQGLYARALPWLRVELGEAVERGQLRREMDIESIAVRLTTIGWSAINGWILGLIPLERLEAHRVQDDASVLYPWARGMWRDYLMERVRAAPAMTEAA